MKRIAIRDSRSRSKVKTRVLDYVRADDGTEWLETKDDKLKKAILLEDFFDQIEEARNNKNE